MSRQDESTVAPVFFAGATAVSQGREGKGYGKHDCNEPP